MCGIAGIIDTRGGGQLSSQLANMLKPIEHRGPDDRGVWIDDRNGVALGHRRLSVLDLSAAGHQPMMSACERFVVVFNGEIYNHLDIRASLQRPDGPELVWRGHSDTETLLAAIASLGIEAALQATVGMFAFALWDRQERALTLARDRIGEKPLYYGWHNGVFFFGSELKALRAHPSFEPKVDWHAASSFLRSNYIPAPATIYQGIRKLCPGTLLRLSAADIAARALPEPRPYWSLNRVVARGISQPFKGTFEDAVAELDTHLSRAVKQQSIADVPVGAFLSGGIDSSTIVALMRAVTSSDVTTFSIGMPDAQMDESKHAAAVASHLGTKHVAYTITSAEALQLIPGLPQIWDEPFADSSQLPTYLVSKLARQRVTVALSGDGGDELFLGYPRYDWCRRLWRSRAFGQLPWNVVIQLLSRAGSRRAKGMAKRASALVGAWRQPSPEHLYRFWTDNYRRARVPLRGEQPLHDNAVAFDDALTAFSVVDAHTYLPDDVMVKVDRAAMANSLETRAPLLDHRIVEFAFSLPLAYKADGIAGKRVLREVLYRYVPRQLLDRPKMGFALPMSSWLRNDLREWSEDLLLGDSRYQEFFDQSAVQALWADHLSGIADNTERLWGLLTLKAWLNAR